MPRLYIVRTRYSTRFLEATLPASAGGDSGVGSRRAGPNRPCLARADMTVFEVDQAPGHRVSRPPTSRRVCAPPRGMSCAQYPIDLAARLAGRLRDAGLIQRPGPTA